MIIMIEIECWKGLSRNFDNISWMNVCTYLWYLYWVSIVSSCFSLSVYLSAHLLIIPPFETAPIFFRKCLPKHAKLMCIDGGGYVTIEPSYHFGYRLSTSVRPSLRVKRVGLARRVSVSLDFWHLSRFHEGRYTWK